MKTMSMNPLGKGNPALDIAAAGAGGAVPPGTTVAAGAPLPQGYLIQFVIRPRENILAPRITAFGRERGAGRVTLVFDPDARAILRSETPGDFLTLLQEQLARLLLTEEGNATAAWQEVWLDPNTP